MLTISKQCSINKETSEKYHNVLPIKLTNRLSTNIKTAHNPFLNSLRKLFAPNIIAL